MSENPTVRLALAGCISSVRDELKKKRYPFYKDADPGLEVLEPALLVAYPYLESVFLKVRHKYVFRDWVLDSGAFSAFNSGMVINLQEYIDTCKRFLATDSQLTEVFSLDVIGDWQESLTNCEAMWEQEVPAIPCYHIGEPEHVLLDIAKRYPKIALGGVAKDLSRRKMKFAEQCFARVWPKKIHGFGFGSEDAIMALPWHSVDSTSWDLGPAAFGRWLTVGKVRDIRGAAHDMRGEVLYYLDIERRARLKWAGAWKNFKDKLYQPKVTK